MTPHISAEINEIAKNVIMPGDPLRAKYIAENFLDNYKMINSVRNIYGYTGLYKNKEVTVFASGMGNPSMGIYSYELYKFYNVENIIRIGTAGSYKKEIKLLDIVLAEKSYSKSTFAKTQNGYNEDTISASNELNNKIIKIAKNINLNLHIGTVLCSDIFYKDNKENYEEISKYNCLACEMESFALFSNARILNKNASCLLTISNMMDIENSTELTIEEREKSLNDMIKLALNTLIV